ncbi:MAG: Na+/H+ antiporter subunit E [Actinomycetota bacterium]|nr:Na+/H+ antiporter subunit E [Actinomycetota bacterium]MDZ4178575.1 Na+/H+ antiporter subunit E [Coriobacteriia bacterium]
MPDITRSQTPRYSGLSAVIRFAERAVLFAAAWWILVEGDNSSWLFGVPFSLFAAMASVRLTPRRGWVLRPVGTLRFIGYFAWHSIAGGIDVALRAVRPSMPISPGFISCPLRLAGDPARVLLADTVSLLPGTLSSGLVGDSLVLHVLDCSMPVIEDVRRVEERIADALGLQLIDADEFDATHAGGEVRVG